MAQIIWKSPSKVLLVSSVGYKPGRHQQKKSKIHLLNPGMSPESKLKEAKRLAVLYDEQVRSGKAFDSNIRFDAFVRRWWESYALVHLQPKTLQSYESQLQVINSFLGTRMMGRITPKDILDFHDRLNDLEIRDKRYRLKGDLAGLLKRKSMKTPRLAADSKVSQSAIRGVMHGRNISGASARAIATALDVKMGEMFSPVDKNVKLSGSSRLSYHRLLHSILETAASWQVIPTNPADHVRGPKKEPREIVFLDDEQSRVVVAHLLDVPIQNRMMILTLLHFGLRRGELLGLKWSDIDFGKSELHVRRALQYLPSRGTFLKEPKTPKSVRNLSMSATIIQLFKEYRAWCLEQKIACGDAWQDNDLVFSCWNGGFYNPARLSRWFKEFVTGLGLPTATLHSLRHTNASLQLAAGVEISTVSRRLGHSSQAVTMSTYLHSMRSADKAATEALESILAPVRTAEKT
jgi:integrase